MMDLKDSENFDERQLMERGKIFKNALVLLVVFFAADALTNDFGVNWIINSKRAIVIIAIVCSYSSIRLILKDAYSGKIVNWNVGMIIFSVVGISLLILNIGELIKGNEGLIENGMLSRLSASLIIAVSFLSIATVYWYKHFQNKKAELNDSE